MQRQKSLMLGWLSFSELGSNCVTYCFAYKCSQYIGYAKQQPIHFPITLLTRTKIIDAPLMLILMYCLADIWRHP